MKKILAPTDFSETAQNSIEYAVRLAIQANAQLVLFHAYQASPVPLEVPLTQLELDEMYKRSHLSLEAIREGLYHRYGQDVEVECVCRYGFAEEEISDFALEYGVDIIVMGMQGSGYISEKVIGSVTTNLMQNSPCPLLVIDRHVTFAEIKKVVFACDYVKPPRRETIDSLNDFVDVFTSPWIYVVNVVGNNSVLISSLEARSKPRLQELLKNQGHSFHSVEDKDISAGLHRFAEQKQADLMVMVPRRYAFWRGIFYLPLTKRMAFHSSIPLLILQP